MASKWILRKGSKEKGFSYSAPDGKALRKTADLDRIAALRIPPAWREVHIAANQRAAIQAWGLDARGRKQYRYHPRAVEKGEMRKYYRVREMARDLPRIRARLNADFRKRGLTREKVCAGVLRLIADGFFRVGSELETKRKKFLRDGVQPERLSDGLGALPSVIFSPRDVELVGGGAGERRRFLDLILALTSRKYLHALQQYRGALAQRNAALRSVARNQSGEESVSVWEPTLAKTGAIVVAARAEWVEASRAAYSSLCARIGERGEATMCHQTTFDVSDSIGEQIAGELERNRARDIRRGVTSAGPHRDDLVLTLDGQPLRVFGSAGQHRTAAIALRILEGATLKRSAGAEPILLFDDPFAELDAGRAERILDLIQESGRGQTILVVPRATDIPTELTRLPRFRIRSGVISAEAA